MYAPQTFSHEYGNADDTRTSQLKINDACKNTSHRLIQQLRMTNMLEDLGTRAPTRVLAEETVSMSVGAYGYVMGGSKTYKVRLTLKLRIFKRLTLAPS
jgi:hypothetical protein